MQTPPLPIHPGNLKPPHTPTPNRINSCCPVKLPSGPGRRTAAPPRGPGPNPFQRELMRKLIISNEELATEAPRKDCQHRAAGSKRSPRRPTGLHPGAPQSFSGSASARSASLAEEKLALLSTPPYEKSSERRLFNPTRCKGRVEKGRGGGEVGGRSLSRSPDHE